MEYDEVAQRKLSLEMEMENLTAELLNEDEDEDRRSYLEASLKAAKREHRNLVREYQR